MELFPDPMVERVAQRFKVLGEPLRLRLLNHLQQGGPMTVQDLVEATGQRQANVSKHLGLMAKEGILTRKKKGLNVYYDICDSSLQHICSMVCGRLRDELRREQDLLK